MSAFKDELLDSLQALKEEMNDLLFVPEIVDENSPGEVGYMNGCEDTKREAIQLLEKKIKDLKDLK